MAVAASHPESGKLALELAYRCIATFLFADAAFPDFQKEQLVSFQLISNCKAEY